MALVLIIPLLLSLLYAAACFAGVDIDYLCSAPFVLYIPPVLFILVPLSLATAGMLLKTRESRLYLLATVSPCALAPFAIMFPWAAVPGAIGMGYGGCGFFLHWLTKYPNVGPINYEVLLGIICVLVSSFISAVFAYYYCAVRKPRWTMLLVLFAIDLAAYVPVLWRLDWALFIGGVIGYPSMAEGAAIREFHALVGPVFRLVALLVMALMMVISPCPLARRNQPHDFRAPRAG